MLEPAAAIARGVLDEAQRGMPQAQRLACRELLGHIIGNLGG